MAKSTPGKQNFFSQIMPILVVFLAVQLLMMSCPKTEEKRTSLEVLTTMHSLNTQAKDVSLANENRSLDGILDSELKGQKITQVVHDERQVEGQILTAHAQLAEGVFYKENGRMLVASQGLESLANKFRDTPIWTTLKVKTGLDGKEWTPESLYDDVVTTLSASNKKDLIYGVIPGYDVIDAMVHATGAIPGFSYWFACFLLALCVRTIVYPLTQKQLIWGRQMAQLQPLAREIREKHKEATEQQMKTMQLYKEYGLNPYAGCLPALVQLPLFLTVYQFMLHYRFEFLKGQFLWIHTGATGFFAPNLGIQDQLLILIYGVTMVVSTLLTPVSDPAQANQQRMMGVGIALMFTGSMFFRAFSVPSAFVLYWTFTNLLATVQSLRAYRMPMPKLEKVTTPTGGVIPQKKAGFMDRLQDMMQDQMSREQELKKTVKGDTKIIPADPIPEKTSKNGKAKQNPNIQRPKRRQDNQKPGDKKSSGED